MVIGSVNLFSIFEVKEIITHAYYIVHELMKKELTFNKLDQTFNILLNKEPTYSIGNCS